MSHITSPTDVYTLDTRIFFKHLSREKPLALIIIIILLSSEKSFPSPLFSRGGFSTACVIAKGCKSRGLCVSSPVLKMKGGFAVIVNICFSIEMNGSCVTTVCNYHVL